MFSDRALVVKLFVAYSRVSTSVVSSLVGREEYPTVEMYYSYERRSYGCQMCAHTMQRES